MDYCSSCRRHLNGALVCPGCGAYAPDIAPPLWQGPGAADEGEAPRDADQDGADDPDGTGQDDAVPSPRSRAARRRQLERWRKSRRRAAAATAVALVGGGLTVAAIPHGGHGGRAHTAAGQPTPAGARTLPLSPIPARAGDDAAHRPGRPARSDAHAAPRGTALSAARTTVAADPAPRGATGPRARQGTAGTAPADAAPTYTAGRTTAPRTTTPSSAPHSPADVPATPPTTTATPMPSATTSPMRLCLLVLCVG